MTWQPEIAARLQPKDMVAPVLATSIAVDSRLLNSINGLLAVAVSAAPLLSADLASKPSELLAQFVPFVGRLLAAVLRAIATACENMRVKREQLFVLVHGAMTYIVGDAIAQAAMRRGKTVAWVPSTTAWAAVVGLLSDTIMFYHWSTFLAALQPRGKLLRKRPALMLPLKIALHLATFQPLSTASYLYLQGLVKSGGSFPSALHFMRRKFAAAILPALTTFLVGGPLIYSLPVVAGAALRNLGVLAMCIYLAVVAAR